MRAANGFARQVPAQAEAESTFAGQHDAMRTFEERQTGLQRIATETRTGHQTGALSATESNAETQKHTGKHH
jgi:hypothetical protein